MYWYILWNDESYYFEWLVKCYGDMIRGVDIGLVLNMGLGFGVVVILFGCGFGEEVGRNGYFYCYSV